MTKFVHEIMCTQLFYLRGEETHEMALLGVLALGISGAPVLCPDGFPVGVVSIRDLVGDRRGRTVEDRMSAPAIVIHHAASVDDAGKKMALHSIHRLVVVDDDSRVVGIVSSLDLVRSLVGLRPRHPASLTQEHDVGLRWSDTLELSAEQAGNAPSAGGLLTLTHGGDGSAEIAVWAESSGNLRQRLRQLAQANHERQEPPQLHHLLRTESHNLSFRTAQIDDAEKRAAALLEAQRRVAAE